MIIKNKIKLGNIQYYIKVECVYKKNNNSYSLCLKNNNDYFDSGDLSLLIEELEIKSNYEMCYFVSIPFYSLIFHQSYFSIMSLFIGSLKLFNVLFLYPCDI